MKKYILIALAMLATSTIHAQEEQQESAASKGYKPEAGTFSTEVCYAPLSTSNSVALEGGQLKGIYALNDKFSLRLGLGFGINSEKSEDDGTKTTTTTRQLSLTPGVSYAMEGTSRLTPYIGGELLFAFEGDKTTIEGENAKEVTTNGNKPLNTFGINAFAGFNYYFAEHLYAGIEFGIGLKGTVNKDKEVETTINGKTTKVTSDVDESTIDFAPYIVPSLRLGWSF